MTTTKGGGITTNLLGRRVRITIGLNDEELTREIESMRRRTASVWRGDARNYLGQFGEVTAVFKDADHTLQFTLALDGGNFATVAAGHCRLLTEAKPYDHLSAWANGKEPIAVAPAFRSCVHGSHPERCETCATGMDDGGVDANGNHIE